ncbi:hypothetical protein [Rubritalea tangerina]|uniref:hypothetical protein n=1 Tax=Rubritalea tangerina TaxID=430798 RepID=UPI0036102B7A
MQHADGETATALLTTYSHSQVIFLEESSKQSFTKVVGLGMNTSIYDLLSCQRTLRLKRFS